MLSKRVFLSIFAILFFVAGLKEEAIKLYWKNQAEPNPPGFFRKFKWRFEKFFIFIFGGKKSDMLRQCDGRPHVNWYLILSTILSLLASI